VTYQLISGRLPYEATSLTELALKQQQEEPPTLDTLVAAVTPELADAVAVALALDPRDRYSTAREMGRALSNGAKGIGPGEQRSAGRVAPPTQATSVLATGGRSTARRSAAPTKAIAPRRPRQGPPRAKPAVVQPVHAAPRPPRRRGRLLLALVAILALALAIVAIVLITAPAPSKVVLRNVVQSDVQQATQALKQLVSENTQ
jgi:serine/threonine-protein kinase